MQLPCLHGSVSPDSTNQELSSSVVFTIEKKSACKWALTIQTPVVQESTVNVNIKSSSTERKRELIHLKRGKIFLTMMQNPEVIWAKIDTLNN